MQERKQRSDAGQPIPMPRDELTLTWIGEQYTATFDQLQRLLVLYSNEPELGKTRLSDTATRNAVTRWQQLGFIEKPKRLWYQYTSFIWLTRAGLIDLGLPYRPYTPKRGQVHHLVAVNEVRLNIQGAAQRPDIWTPKRTLMTAHELVHKRREEHSEAKQEPTVFPDGLLDRNLAVYVVERPRQRQDLLILALGLLKQYDALRFYVCPEMVQILTEIRADCPPCDQFDLYDLITMQPITSNINTVPGDPGGFVALPAASCAPHASNPAKPGKSKIKANRKARISSEQRSSNQQ